MIRSSLALIFLFCAVSTAYAQFPGNQVSNTFAQTPCVNPTANVLPVLNVTGGFIALFESTRSPSGGTSMTSVTDNNGGSWNLISGNSNPSCFYTVGAQIAWSFNHPLGNTTITVNQTEPASTTCGETIEAQDFLGIGTSATLDPNGAATTGNSASQAIGPISTTNPPVIVLAWAGICGGTTCDANSNPRTAGPTNGFNELTDITAAGIAKLYPSYANGSTTGPYNTSWTSTNSDCWASQERMVRISIVPTPTATATGTATATATATPTATQTATPSATPTMTVICPSPAMGMEHYGAPYAGCPH